MKKKNPWDSNQFKKSKIKGNKDDWAKAANSLLKPLETQESDMKVLGISKLSSLSELTKARNKIMLKAHPDRGGSDGEARLIIEAFERLKVIILQNK
jgi:DnaJ-class molecular chaperone